MVMLPGQKDRTRAREYHLRAGLYTGIYIYIYILFFFGRPLANLKYGAMQTLID